MKNKSIVIFLTATLKPGAYGFVGRSNLLDRELDYYNAVKFYMTLGLPIVFVDNSECECEKILEISQDYPFFEYFTFKSEKSIEGKGHGEKEIIDYALEHSLLMKNTEWIIKISGRYIIENIFEILDKIEFNNNEVFANYTRNMRWIDTRFFIIKKSFYSKYFKPFIEKYLDEKNNVILEHIFARSVHMFQATGGEISIWPAYPYYQAHDGTNGEKVSFNFYKKIKYRFYFKIKNYMLGFRV